MRHIQQREEHWAIIDLHGKAGHTRTVPVPDWGKAVLDEWTRAANITSGRVFRRVNKSGGAWGSGMTEKVIWHVVREYATLAGITPLAPMISAQLCPPMPRGGRRTGPDSIPAWVCLYPDN